MRDHEGQAMNPNQVPKKNANRSHLKNQRGNIIVEMSLLLLPFILIIMGVMEFGWYFLHQHTLQYATREGIRAGRREAPVPRSGHPPGRRSPLTVVPPGFKPIQGLVDTGIWQTRAPIAAGRAAFRPSSNPSTRQGAARAPAS